MSTKGPIGKRSEERQRRNAPEIPLTKVDVAALVKMDVEIPEADEDWHPIARRLYESLKESGQCVFYEPSDWAAAYLMAESISRDLKPQVVGVNPETGKPVLARIPLKGASLSAYAKMFNVLMMTEGDRRRLQAEITRTSQATITLDDPNVHDISTHRREAVGN